MKNQAYEQIQARELRVRLPMLRQVQCVTGNVTQTYPFFGVSRALSFIREKCYEKNDLTGPRDQR
jgi:hypothetical protein